MLNQAMRLLARAGLHLTVVGVVILALVPDAVASSVNLGTVTPAGAIQLAQATSESAVGQAAAATSKLSTVARSSAVTQALTVADATSRATTSAVQPPRVSPPAVPDVSTTVALLRPGSPRRVARRSHSVRLAPPPRSASPQRSRGVLHTRAVETWPYAGGAVPQSPNSRSATSQRPESARSNLGGRPRRWPSASASESSPAVAVVMPGSFSVISTGGVAGAASGGSGAGPAVAVLLAFILLLLQVLLAGRLPLDVLPWHSALAESPPERPG